jgi:hypothetical protein
VGVSAWALTRRSAGYLTTERLQRARLAVGRQATRTAQYQSRTSD